LCENCEVETDDLVEIESLKVCRSCVEDLELTAAENDSSDKCVICNWPINRTISEENSRKFVEGIRQWLKGKCSQEVFDRIARKLSFLENREASVCRYDFFLLAKEIIEEEDAELGKKFEDVLRVFDFGGRLIS
jgi:predicted transcriptional regulator